MYLCLRSMIRMLIMLLIGLYCRLNQMENSSWSLYLYSRKISLYSRTEKSSMLKCSGNTFICMNYMGDGRSNAGYVSFVVFRLRKRNIVMVVWYILYDGMVFSLCRFGTYFTMVWCRLYGILVFSLSRFYICFMMLYDGLIYAI